jgi:hypothetical protein
MAGTAAGTHDAQDIAPEIGEEHAAEWCRSDARELDDLDVTQGR